MTRIRQLLRSIVWILSLVPAVVFAQTYTIPFSDIQQAIDAGGGTPDEVIRAHLAGLIRDELDELGFDVDAGIVLDDIPLDEMTTRLPNDCDYPRPYEIHTDATTAVVSIDSSSSLTLSLDSIRSINLSAELSGSMYAAADAWVRWGQDIIFVGECIKLNTDHGWIGITSPFDISLDLALELNPSYDAEQLAIVVDKQAVLTGQADLSGGDIDHDFGTLSLTDLVISVFKDELLEALAENGEEEIDNAIAALNLRLDGLDENGLPDPGIEAFNGPTTFVLEVDPADLPFVRELLAQYGIPEIVIAMLDDRGIEVLLNLAVLEGAEREAYLAELGATASCEVLLAAFETPLERVPLYSAGAEGCAVALPGDPDAGAYFSDAACTSPVAYRPTADAQFCADRFGENAEAILGNAAAWVADLDQPNDPLPGTRSQSWTSIPSTQLDLGAVSLAGNYQPYLKKLAYKTIDDVGRGSGTCELEMRVYKKDIVAQGLRPVIALHGGTWQHRGYSYLGLEAGISQLTERGFIVFAPFYRLVGDSDGNPECNAATWHEVTADAESALDWVRDNGTALGAAAEPVNVYGQSAGGHLAAWLAAHRPADVRKALIFYGPLDALEFLADADGRYAAFKSFGLRSLTRFFGAEDLVNEVRLGMIDAASLSVAALESDWGAAIPDAVFDLGGIDPLAPPPFVRRCADTLQIAVSAIDLLAPPQALVDCMKEDLARFLVDNSFTHLLRDEAVPIGVVHGTADTLVPYQQALDVCGAIDRIVLPEEVSSPLTTYACGLSSEIQLVDGADHALELGVCLDSICPAGQFGSPLRLAVETAIGAAMGWLVVDPLVATDSDGDGTPDHQDAFPNDPSESMDSDRDGIGNNADPDDDDDGRLDVDDAFPLDPLESVDSDNDGLGNTADTDDDNDGVADVNDNCPVVANPDQADADGNSLGDACEPRTALAAQLPDVDGDGTAEVAVIYRSRDTGEFILEVQSGRTATTIGTYYFGSDPVLALRIVGDLDANGAAEFAVLSELSSGRARVQLRDGDNGYLLGDLTFSAGLTPVDMTVLPDTDGDGNPEIAVLATRDSDGRVAAEMRNAAGPETAPRFIWFSPNHEAVALAAIPGDADGDGVAELAVLLRRLHDGRNRIDIRNANGPENPNVIWLGIGSTATDVTIVDDGAANSTPRVAVLTTLDSDSRPLVLLRNAAGPLEPSSLRFTIGYTPIAFSVVDDADSNGVPDIALLLSRNSDGRTLLQTRNVAGPVEGRAIWYAPGFNATGLVVLDDLDGNLIDEGGALMHHHSDGRIVLQRRNLSGSVDASNYWFD